MALIRLLVAEEMKYNYCISLNRDILKLIGVADDDQLAAIMADPRKAPIPEKEIAMLELVLKVFTDPEAVEAADIQHLRDLGWTDADVPGCNDDGFDDDERRPDGKGVRPARRGGLLERSAAGTCLAMAPRPSTDPPPGLGTSEQIFYGQRFDQGDAQASPESGQGFVVIANDPAHPPRLSRPGRAAGPWMASSLALKSTR